MLAIITSATFIGIEPKAISVEADIGRGLPAFQIIGLPDAAIKEARDRVKSAIRNSGLEFPRHRLTVNLAPAHLRKDRAQCDLAIAMAILAAQEVIPRQLATSLFYGELSLNGYLKPSLGALSILSSAQLLGLSELFLPDADAITLQPYLHLFSQLKVWPVRSVRQLTQHLQGKQLMQPLVSSSDLLAGNQTTHSALDGIIGQYQAKRVLEISAAGHHNLLFIGPPGIGKTVMAEGLSDLLPPLESREQLELLGIQRLWQVSPDMVASRPFRSPHHTSSLSQLLGRDQLPGELSLAHGGILFFDELLEFPRSSLELLRAPLESGYIERNYYGQSIRLPARFLFVGAANNCPCGKALTAQSCQCTANQLKQYWSRLSAPLLDRIPLIVRLDGYQPVSMAESHYTFERMSGRVLKASALLRNANGKAAESQLLEQLVARYTMSPRRVKQLLSVSRTIAALDGRDRAIDEDLAEAASFVALPDSF